MNIQIDRQNDVPRITENGKLVYSEKSDTLYIRTLKEGTKAIGGNSSIIETDPVFTSWLASPPNVSTFTNDVGYLTTFSETDPIYTASSWYSTTNNSSNWDTAYGWGNHASVGYLTGITSGDVTTALGYTPVTNARTLTINGTTYDLSANRSWTISTGTTYTFSTGLTDTAGTITSNLSTGISGGQSVIGGTASGNNLTLSSTSNATKGKILFGTSAYDEVNNSLGIGRTNPGGILDIYKSDNANPLLMRIWNGGSGGAKLRFVAETGGTAQHQWTTDKFLAAIAANNTIGMQFRVGLNATEAALDASTRMTITTNGKVGIGTTTPTALLMLAAGTATANTAPLKFTTGTNLTTAEAGVMEYNNTFHLTNSDATRRHIVTAPNTTKITASAPYANDGYIIVNIAGTDFKILTTA